MLGGMDGHVLLFAATRETEPLPTSARVIAGAALQPVILRLDELDAAIADLEALVASLDGQSKSLEGLFAAALG